MAYRTVNGTTTLQGEAGNWYYYPAPGMQVNFWRNDETSKWSWEESQMDSATQEYEVTDFRHGERSLKRAVESFHRAKRFQYHREMRSKTAMYYDQRLVESGF